MQIKYWLKQKKTLKRKDGILGDLYKSSIKGLTEYVWVYYLTKEIWTKLMILEDWETANTWQIIIIYPS